MPKVRENIQLGFAACRMGFRKCWLWMLCRRPLIIIKDQYEVLCLGLCGAGKSTVLANLVGEPTDDLEPTTGFNIKTLPVKHTVLNIKELGGSDSVRPFWNRYFLGQHGLLFVIDLSQDDDELAEAKDVLKEVLAEPALKAAPCVLIGTHEDLPCSKTEREVREYFGEALRDRPWQMVIGGLNNRSGICDGVDQLVDLMSNDISIFKYQLIKAEGLEYLSSIDTHTKTESIEKAAQLSKQPIKTNNLPTSPVPSKQ